MTNCSSDNTIYFILLILIILYLINNKNSENFNEVKKPIYKRYSKNYDKLLKDKNYYKDEFCIQRENICKKIIDTKKEVDKHIKDFIVLKDSTSGSIKDYINEKKNKFFVIQEKLDDLVKTGNEEFKCFNDKTKSLNKNCNNSSEESPDESPEDNIFN